MLDDRRSLVLEALVEEYIRSGEPVSSRIISLMPFRNLIQGVNARSRMAMTKCPIPATC